jgi:hypothetical protein
MEFHVILKIISVTKRQGELFIDLFKFSKIMQVLKITLYLIAILICKFKKCNGHPRTGYEGPEGE